MPAKKSKGTVTKKRPSHGKATKKASGANKTKTKASKRKSQAKKRHDKYRQKQRKERKRADKAKRTAKKTGTKTTKKSKDKKKKKDPKKKEKKASEAGKQQEQSDEEDAGENEEGKVEMKFTGMSVNQMQNLRQQVVELTKDEFLEQIKETAENHSEDARFQSAYMGSAENRMKLFYDSERPTDGSKGPFQSNRFGAVFLIPGQQ